MDNIKMFLTYSSKKFKLIIIDEPARVSYNYYIKINKKYKWFLTEHDYGKNNINYNNIYKNLDYGLSLLK